MMNHLLFRSNRPLTVPVQRHQSLVDEDSVDSSELPSPRPSGATESDDLPMGQRERDGYPVCDTCDQVLEPIFAQSCGHCHLYYHIGCGDKFFIGGIWYFELCRGCADRMHSVKSKLYDEIREAGIDWNEELWVHVIVRNHRKGRGLIRPPYKYMHRLQKHICMLLRLGQPLERLPQEGHEGPMLRRNQDPAQSTTPPPEPRIPQQLDTPPTNLSAYVGRRNPQAQPHRPPGVSSSSN